MYSQGEEEKYITAFFEGFTGTLCSIGENDGITFSNARRLIELGWHADLFEPSKEALKKLSPLYEDHDRVMVHGYAIGETTGKVDFNESGSLITDADNSLVSTMIDKEKDRWGDKMNWTRYSVYCFTWDSFFLDNEERLCEAEFIVTKERKLIPVYDFITIDAEGLDIVILKQIDLSPTKLLCIEHNSIHETGDAILEYCATFGMTKILYENGENLLICRP